MQRLVLTLALAATVALAGLWLAGGFDVLARWAAEGQREFQNAMAGTLRRLRAGEAGALAALLGVCFAYGFFHAAGPGHGKVLIGGYGAGSGVRLGPLMGIALAASLAQATTAVVLVYAGVFAFDWTRERVVNMGEEVMAPASYAAVALIGLWLAARGARGLARQWRPAYAVAGGAPGNATPPDLSDHHHHHHAQGEPCETCGHRHGPSPGEVAALRGWRDALVLIGGIAIRPCTGALFLLILTWRMGIDAAGIAGAYAMGLGTASVTVAVAALAVLARDGALVWLGGMDRARRALPLLELAAGLVVAFVAVQLLLRGM